MHLTPADTEKLLLAVAGMVARDRLDRGVRLNHPESVALLVEQHIGYAVEHAAEFAVLTSGRVAHRGQGGGPTAAAAAREALTL